MSRQRKAPINYQIQPNFSMHDPPQTTPPTKTSHSNKKTAKFQENQKEEKNIDLMSQLQSFGLETVILEQNTNSDGASDDDKEGHHREDYLGATMQMDHDQQILDFSKLHFQLNKSAKIEKPDLQKYKQMVKAVKEMISRQKNQNSTLKSFIKEMTGKFKDTMKSIQIRIQSRIQSLMFEYKSETIAIKEKNRQTTKQLENLRRQFHEKQQHLNKAELDNKNLANKVKQLQEREFQLEQKKHPNSSLQLLNLKNKIRELEYQRQTLREELSILSKDNFQLKQNSTIGTKNNDVTLKQKYIMIMEQFSEQITQLQADISDLRERDCNQNANLENWEKNLENQQIQVENIIANLEMREQMIARKEEELEEREEWLNAKQSELQNHRYPAYSPKTIYPQYPRDYEDEEPEYHYRTVNNYPQHQYQNQQRLFSPRPPMERFNQIKSTMNSPKSFQMKNQRNYNIYSYQPQIPTNHRSFNTQQVSNLNRFTKKTSTSNKSKFANRIQNIQSSIKRQLEEIGYRI